MYNVRGVCKIVIFAQNLMDMKRFLLFILVPFLLVSCEKYGESATLTVVASMVGMEDGASSTHAVWGEKEELYLFNTADWMPATFSMLSGAGSTSAEFQGVITTAKRYRGLRGDLVSVKANGEALLRVEDKNIFFEDENSANVAPMTASGSGDGVSFKSVFGAVKFVIDQEFEFNKLKVEVSTNGLGLNGAFYYNMSQNVVSNSAVSHSATRILSSEKNLATTPIYVAMPPAGYESVSLIVSNTKSHRSMRYTATGGVVVKQNSVSTPSGIDAVEVPAYVGTWHLVSIFDKEVDVDLYVSLFENNSFKLYQRVEATGYTIFEGTYTYDDATSVLSGVYSDGTAWANSYRIEFDAEGLMRWVNMSDESEISVYESSAAPTAGVSSRNRTVKPLL